MLHGDNHGRVLVAHGDPGVRFALAQVLMQEGWTVRLARNDEELLDGLAWGADVVVVDEDLPGGSIWRSPEVQWVVIGRTEGPNRLRWPDVAEVRAAVARAAWEGGVFQEEDEVWVRAA